MGIGLAVAVEKDGAGADVEALDVLLHEVGLGKGLDVDIISIVLALAVVAGIGTDGVPGVLEPVLDLIGRSRHICRAFIQRTVDREQIVAHLFDGDQVII